jgi:hypothetical protein
MLPVHRAEEVDRVGLATSVRASRTATVAILCRMFFALAPTVLLLGGCATSIPFEFQKRHSYQLALRDYADIVNWITKYGTTRKTS